MLLKITGKNAELFQENLTAVLNIATVFCQRGHIPTPDEQTNAQQHGRYWWREGKKINLYSMGNDFWAWVQDGSEMETSVTLWFTYRYDRNNLMDALINLIHLRFPEDTEILEK